MQLMYFLYPNIENSFHIRITNPVHSDLWQSRRQISNCAKTAVTAAWHTQLKLNVFLWQF
jgi:hypothetical protein